MAEDCDFGVRLSVKDLGLGDRERLSMELDHISLQRLRCDLHRGPVCLLVHFQF